MDKFEDAANCCKRGGKRGRGRGRGKKEESLLAPLPLFNSYKLALNIFSF